MRQFMFLSSVCIFSLGVASIPLHQSLLNQPDPVYQHRRHLLNQPDPVYQRRRHLDPVYQHRRHLLNQSDDNECEACPFRYTCVENRCQHKGLFEAFDVNDFFTIVLSLIAVSFAAACGTGGGGLLVPLFAAIELFSTKEAIPLSKATIFGGSVASLLVNIRKRHPSADRPLIDLNIAVVFEPMALAGTTLGVMFNSMFPEWLIVLLLIVLLVLTTLKTYRKGVQKRQAIADNRDRESQRIADIVNVDSLHADVDLETDTKELNNVRASDEPIIIDGKVIEISSQIPTDKSLADLERDERSLHCKPVLLLAVAWGATVLLAVLKGGHGAPGIAGVECGGALYWLLAWLILPLMVAVAIAQGKSMVAQHENKCRVNYQFCEGDIQWTQRTAMKLPLLNYGAGVAAGMLGIGGGMVQGPLLMALNVSPAVAAATSATMVLFTSSATTFQFIAYGMLQYDFAAFFAFVGFVGSIIGQRMLSYCVKDESSTYKIIFTLAAVIGASCVCLTIIGVLHILSQIQTGEGGWGFTSICSTHG